MADKTEQVIVHAEPCKVELQRSAKGDYYWTISSYGVNLTITIEDLIAADKQLKEKYYAPADNR